MTSPAPEPTEILRKVAEAIEPLAWAALGCGDTKSHAMRRDASLVKARAAIGAMREATPGMVTAGTAGRKAVESILAQPNTLGTYTAMIDSALGTEPTP